ncbi:MAG: DUF86 domain-containing protein [Actinobacteria bacterium]|nr:DUF86 domain-containing protein [Actinomycetota bacterium]
MQRDLLLLSEIIGAIERIIQIAGDVDLESPELDRDRIDALLWNFTVLGEASNQVSDDIKTDHADVPWSDPVRLRNRIVHGYWSVDLDVLLATAHNDLPAMLLSIRAAREGIEP